MWGISRVVAERSKCILLFASHAQIHMTRQEKLVSHQEILVSLKSKVPSFRPPQNQTVQSESAA